jgi:hypothetical protein
MVLDVPSVIEAMFFESTGNSVPPAEIKPLLTGGLQQSQH